MNPMTTSLDVQERFWEDAREIAEDLDELPESAAAMLDVEVGQTPSEVVYHENKLDLLHYEPDREPEHRTPVLFVYALINKPYILDLQPDLSVIRDFVEHGFDVYMIDWGEPSRLDRHLTLDDYVNRYIANCVDVVRDRSGEDAINVFGYCMGGTMSAMYAALNPEKVRNLILMASGLHFDETGGVLELWGDGDYYEPRDVADAFGNAPSDFLDTGFDLMDPVQNLVTKYVHLAENMDDRDFVENFARMETWLSDGVDVPGEAYVEFLEWIYQENRLYRNELELGGRHVDVERIDMPVLQVLGEYDHLIPPEASKPFNDVIGSDDATYIEHPSGHIGLSVSGSSHKELWPEVCDWLAARSDGDGSHGPVADAGESEESDLESIDGVGPTYAERLRNAGFTRRAEVAEASASALAEAAEVSEARARGWIDDARE